MQSEWVNPPGVAYLYAPPPDCKAEQLERHLVGFAGVLQVDGYAGYEVLAERNAVSLAFYWSHVRRRFYDLAQSGPVPRASRGAGQSSKPSSRGCAPSSRWSARRASSPTQSATRSHVASSSRHDLG